MAQAAPRASLVAGAAVLLALALLPPAALAQVPAPQVTVEIDQASLRLEAAASAIVNATITYADAVPGAQGTVALTVDAPEGWTVVIEPTDTFPLNAGGTQTVTLNVTAPAAATGAQLADATLTATVTAGAGRAPGTDTATLGLERVDPLPPPPANPWPLVVALGALLVGAGAAALLVARHRRRARAAAAHAAYLDRETGITIEPAGEPMPFGDRREVAVRLAVKNVTSRPRTAVVAVHDVPPGWLAAVNVPRRDLAPGEAMTITLTIRPPDGAPLGAEATLAVAARPQEALERDERVTLHVRAPDARPVGHAARPIVAARDGVIPKTIRL